MTLSPFRSVFATAGGVHHRFRTGRFDEVAEVVGDEHERSAKGWASHNVRTKQVERFYGHCEGA